MCENDGERERDDRDIRMSSIIIYLYAGKGQRTSLMITYKFESIIRRSFERCRNKKAARKKCGMRQRVRERYSEIESERERE